MNISIKYSNTHSSLFSEESKKLYHENKKLLSNKHSNDAMNANRTILISESSDKLRHSLNDPSTLRWIGSEVFIKR